MDLGRVQCRLLMQHVKNGYLLNKVRQNPHVDYQIWCDIPYLKVGGKAGSCACTSLPPLGYRRHQ